jgi:hypothetical protein
MGLAIEMPKSTMTCAVTLYPNYDSAVLYTCGDVPSEGGTIACDTNSSGNSSASDPTNASTCDINAANFGAFLLTNNGTDALLNATVLNITVNNITNYELVLDNYIFDAVSAPGCNGTLCNNCPAANTTGCYKDINATSSDPDSVIECDRFNSGGGLCECFSIHIDDDDIMHQLRNAGYIEFVISKAVAEPVLSNCT